MNLIEVNNLVYSYDKKENVIDGVSFSVEAGKYISIIGHNGSGKSTIAKLLLGLLDSNQYSIKAFGKFLNSRTAREIRTKIGIVFQNPDNQFVGATVADDIAFGLENRRIPQKEMKKIIHELAWKVHMQDYLNKEPENLSGGQKQRVAIASVLAMKPEVIIFDEATSMLDPKGKFEVRKTISEMRKENPNLTIISITHDIEEAFLGDQIIVLKKGKIIFNDTPKKALENKSILFEAGLDIPFKEKFLELLESKNIKVSNKESLERIVEELCQ